MLILILNILLGNSFATGIPIQENAYWIGKASQNFLVVDARQGKLYGLSSSFELLWEKDLIERSPSEIIGFHVFSNGVIAFARLWERDWGHMGSICRIGLCGHSSKSAQACAHSKTFNPFLSLTVLVRKPWRCWGLSAPLRETHNASFSVRTLPLGRIFTIMTVSTLFRMSKGTARGALAGFLAGVARVVWFKREARRVTSTCLSFVPGSGCFRSRKIGFGHSR